MYSIIQHVGLGEMDLGISLSKNEPSIQKKK